MKKILLLMAAVITFTGLHAGGEAEWSLKRDKEGIKIYTRKYENYSYMDKDLQFVKLYEEVQET